MNPSQKFPPHPKCVTTLPGETAVLKITTKLKCAERGSLEIQDAQMMQKNYHLCTIAQLCPAISSN